jgi:hypothetical protein
MPFVNYIPGPVCIAVRAFGALGLALGIVALIAFSLDMDLEGAVGDKIGVDWHAKHAEDDHPGFGARNRGPLTVVTIATRGYDARDWVSSLRNAGHWFGDVVVLSDGCAPDPEDCRVVRIDTKEYGPSSALAAKQFKTRLFELAAPTSSTAILFMDVDIQVNAPLEDYLARVRHLQHKHAHEIHEAPSGQPACHAWFNRERFWQRWKQGHEWQGGFFFLPSAAISTPFLDAWSDQIDLLPPKALDQTALVNALELHSDELRICALPSGAMSYVPDLWSRVWGVSETTFTHWTKSSEVRSWRQTSSTTKAFSLTHFLRGMSIPAEASERHPRRVEKRASEC